MNKTFLIEEKIGLTPLRAMDAALEAIKEVVPYELAVILSLEEENKLKVKYAKGIYDLTKLKNFELNLIERPEIAEALIMGETKAVTETSNPFHKDTYEGVFDFPIGHSCMLAPLVIENKPIGLMTLDHKECDIFTPEKVKITQAIAKIISLALTSSSLADDLYEFNKSLLYERASLLKDFENNNYELIGESKIWRQTVSKIRLVAPTDTNVLLLGETGTGKEQAAKAIHYLSTRSKGPFIALNCSALNVNLAESELFGHEKGSFTGAFSVRKGRFELANGGTLFLDEIGDLPLELQPKLLRALQEGTFERVGGEKTLKSDARIIAATNADLEKLAREGKFREDLFYRLNIFPIQLPPLRERENDALLIANHFLKKMSIKYSKRFILSEDAIAEILSYDWPGNVRELQNAIERSCILAKDGIINSKMLGVKIKLDNKKIVSSFLYDEIIESFDKEVAKIIIKALKKTEGKIYGKDGAAALLKLKPTTLQSKIKKLGIDKKYLSEI